MNPPSEKEFALIMALLGTVFERDGISKQRTDLYYSCLCNIPYELLKRGADRIIRTRKISCLPTPAEIREASLAIAPEDLERGAMEAWTEANRALVSGINQDDPVLKTAIQMAFGGWDRFGELDPSDEPWDRLHFIKCYQLLKKSTAEAKYLVPTFEPKKLKE